MLLDQWRALAAVGVAAMLTYALGGLIQLGVRAVVSREIGLDGAGLYHAGEAILSVNLTLILNAMAADYFPRLSQVADDPAKTTELLNQQLHVVLVLAAPVFILVSLTAPLLLELLFSGEFSSAAFLLRLLIAAGVLRLVIFALAFALLARGAGFWFVAGEAIAVMMLPLIWLLVTRFGLPGAGFGLLLTSLVTCAVYLTQARRLGVTVNRSNLALSAFLLSFCVALACLYQSHPWAALIVGAFGAVAMIWRSARELRSIIAG
jgi:PST family polysaccharide transporter